MDTDLQNEMLIFMKAFKVDVLNRSKVLDTLEDFLKCKKYNDALTKTLNELFKNDFNIESEFSQIVFKILDVNSMFEFYKSVSYDRLKYIIYGIVFNYLTKHQQEIYNNLDLQKIRLLYSSCIDLIELNKENIKVNKEYCCHCINWFSRRFNEKIQP